jgi:hypothetical protein
MLFNTLQDAPIIDKHHSTPPHRDVTLQGSKLERGKHRHKAEAL